MQIGDKNIEIALVGAGIMSATLGVLLKQLIPNANIKIYERLDKVGAESSSAWNNAGTGHSAFCELNYTPQKEDGSIDDSKALRIAEQFEVSNQFWSFLVESKLINTKKSFINDIDHMSFVRGDANVDFLKNRYAALSKHPMFEDMVYTDDHHTMMEWMPLLMEGRSDEDNVAATRMAIGTDVNFGLITKHMIRYLEDCDGVELNLAHEIQDIEEDENGRWKISMENLTTDRSHSILADFVFIGAGGGALTLLDKTEIPESKGYGGFPVSGQWLKCVNPEVIAKHEAKVYGKAEVGSPPMSVPHLDTRIIKGEKCLLFGPYAGFSTKFLKNGSLFDLFLSIESHNVWPMLSAGWNNMDLTKYLVDQVIQSPEERFATLKYYFPNAKFEDWKLEIAGQRVQIIKKDEEEGGVLKFGTEVVKNKNGTMSALLGASPGASTAVSIMLVLLEKCFNEDFHSKDWQEKLKQMIPSFGQSLNANKALLNKTRNRTSSILHLETDK